MDVDDLQHLREAFSKSAVESLIHVIADQKLRAFRSFMRAIRGWGALMEGWGQSEVPELQLDVQTLINCA